MTAPNRDEAATAANDPLSLSGLSGVKPREETFPFLDPPSEVGDLGRLAQYRVLRLLGAGGMGFVFEAEDTHLARRVALKVMRPEFAADVGYRQRFLIEARAAAGLSSDHIVTVYQVGLAGDVPFQAIQLLAGESLQARLEREAPLPVGLAALILRQVAEGMAAAHVKGIFHRDIKPANIWVEGMEGIRSAAPGSPESNFIPPPSSVRVKILDFGLARFEGRDTRLTATGVIVGTPHYMAPEQASGQPGDARSDIFSLGCVAYSMLTGELAFEGSATMAVLMALASHTPPPLTEKNPAVPKELSDLVASMIAKDPAQRPRSAAVVFRTLDKILSEIPDPTGGPAATADTRPIPVRMPRPAPSTGSNAAIPTPAPAALPPVSACLPPRKRRWWLLPAGVGLACLAAVALVLMLGNKGREKDDGSTDPGAQPAAPGEPITVGILHSLSGTMALSEKPVVDATRLAIDEVNAAGGVLGRKLVPVEVDGASDPDKFAQAAEQLLSEKKAAVIFGCWTSAARKAVRDIVQRNNGLLFYPVQYEGLEQSPRIIYLGPSANQQLIPALDFLTKREGKKRLFLVGSDYVFPHAAHAVIKDEIEVRKGKGSDVRFVGEEFLPLGTDNVKRAVAAIKAAAPDAVINTINGTTNFHFFKELNADSGSANIPVLSVSVMETDLRVLRAEDVGGDYLAASCFESVGGPPMRAFVDEFRRRYGPERRYSDPLGAAYCGVHLWAKAAAAANSLDPEAVTGALRGMTFAGPSGEVRIDAATLHTWLPMRIGRINPQGGVEVVEESPRPLQPVPYPGTRRRDEWDLFLNSLYLEWGGKWQAPEPASNKN